MDRNVHYQAFIFVFAHEAVEVTGLDELFILGVMLGCNCWTARASEVHGFELHGEMSVRGLKRALKSRILWEGARGCCASFETSHREGPRCNASRHTL